MVKRIIEIGMKDRNGVQIRLGDTVMAGMKPAGEEIRAWTIELVGYGAKSKEIILVHPETGEGLEMPSDSDCLEVMQD